MGNGEVITCTCFFNFWFYYVNSEKNKNKKKSFSQIIKSVSDETIIEFFSCFPKDYFPSITIKVLNKWNDKFTANFNTYNDQLDEPCVVFSFCQSCHDNIIMIVADMNKLSFEEAKKRSCLDPHELYYLSSNHRKKRCNYCLLNGCFARTVKFVFTTLDDQCLLENKKKMMSELFVFTVSFFVLKKIYRRKKRTVNFNESIKTLSKAVETVQEKNEF